VVLGAAIQLVRSAGGRTACALVVESPVFGDRDELSERLAAAVHAQILEAVGEAEVVQVEGVDAERGTLALGLRCGSWHGIRLEVSAELRRLPGGEQEWGWTWVFPAEEGFASSRFIGAACEVAQAVVRACGER